VERGPLTRLGPRARRNLALAAGALALFAAAAFWSLIRRDSSGPSGSGTRLSAFRPEIRAPEGTRIRVQVLNATRTRGLARRATRYLRDRGFDVVEMGTSAEQRESTLVLDRSGHPEWSALVGRLFDAPVEARPDSSRYLDVTVLLGASWRAPPEALDP
jgi:hypothetical protein